MGLRERKKQQTREKIGDTARDLFLEHGYDAVTVAAIAEQAEVSVTTLFKYFPTKESILFDQELEFESELVAAVVKNAGKKPVREVLLRFFLRWSAFEPVLATELRSFFNLVHSTPELANYSRQVWMRYENNLARAIEQSVRPRVKIAEAEAIAHLALEAVIRSTTAAEPIQSLKLMFKILRNGWRK